jgi:hypothetical protein
LHGVPVYVAPALAAAAFPICALSPIGRRSALWTVQNTSEVSHCVASNMSTLHNRVALILNEHLLLQRTLLQLVDGRVGLGALHRRTVRSARCLAWHGVLWRIDHSYRPLQRTE